MSSIHQKTKAKFIFIFCALFFGLLSLSLIAWNSEKDWASVAALVYTALVTVFLAFQLWAFVLSQVKYSEEVENKKFIVLDAEKKEWLSCLVCGVDSAPMIRFFVFLIGSGLLASALILIWALRNGKFKDEVNAGKIPMNVEGDV